MTNGKRNRNAGHSFELEMADALRKAGFPNVVTSRSENRSRDAQKIDLVNKDEAKNGRLPYNVQCKNSVGKLSYQKLLSELPKNEGIINVLLHKQTEKATTRFITRDKFAILYLNDFFKMVELLDKYKKGFTLLQNHFDFIPDTDKVTIDKELKTLGL